MFSAYGSVCSVAFFKVTVSFLSQGVARSDDPTKNYPLTLQPQLYGDFWLLSAHSFGFERVALALFCRTFAA